MSRARVRTDWCEILLWSAVLVAAAGVPLILPGCGEAPRQQPVDGQLIELPLVIGGADREDAPPPVVSLTDPEFAAAANQVKNLETRMSDPMLSLDVLRTDPNSAVYRVFLDPDPNVPMINFAPIMEGASIQLDVLASRVDDAACGVGAYRWQTDSTPYITVNLPFGVMGEFKTFGTVCLDLQPTPTGYTGSVTDLQASIISLDGNPQTFLHLAMDDDRPSAVSLVFDPDEQVFKGTLQLTVEAQFGSPGDPRLAMALPIRSANLIEELEIATDGAFVAGSTIFPNYASTSPSGDCDGDGTSNAVEIQTGEAQDCNRNGKPDLCDIAEGISHDCDGNHKPDSCQMLDPNEIQRDTNGDGLMEPACQNVDCNGDGTNDALQLGTLDLNHDGYIDECTSYCGGHRFPNRVMIASGQSADCDQNLVPDDCQADIDQDGTIDVCDGCPVDPGKNAPGVCGCGSSDLDLDGDLRAACQDCDGANTAAWATPGEARTLLGSRSGTSAVFTWSPPTDAGGTGVVYDVLASLNPSSFATASCVESNDGPNTTATDPTNAGSGQVIFYVVRAENACPAGEGSLGNRSNGTPRVGRSCPQCVEGAPCSSGNFCIVNETCHSGICGGGIPRTCDDSNACTADLCDDFGDTCVHEVASLNGTSCDDGQFCTQTTTCQNGTCGDGQPVLCGDQNDCTQDICNENTNSCDHMNQSAGTACDDGDPCTNRETCDGVGVCQGSPRCNDHNSCTVESCDDETGSCLYTVTPDGETCDDGDPCTVNEICDDAVCGDGMAANCDDGDPCTADGCQSATGCTHTTQPNGTACGAGRVCTDGLCKLSNGGTCTNGNQCASGICADALCCNEPCNGECEACDDAGSIGTCEESAADTDPDDDCGAYTCDGTGSCRESCAGDEQCDSGHYCSMTVCAPTKPNGASCTAGNECQSGDCADGVCCNEPCNGECEACDDAGSIGTCEESAADTDPDDDCGAYTCDGTGSCRESCAGDEQCDSGHYCSMTVCAPTKPNGASCTAGNECQSGDCADGVCCNEPCNGECEACDDAGSIGTCEESAADTDPDDDCGAYTCDGTGSCRESCAGDEQCDSGHYCSMTVCAPTKPNGASCTAGNECQSGDCADGVCCNEPCNGECEACDDAGSIGTCEESAADTDPDDDCGAYTCDGTGSCRESCAGDEQCDSGHYCSMTVCAPTKPNGASCTAGNECQNGNCVDGVCCNAPCAQTCQSCALTGTVGTCTDAAAFSDPDGECAPYFCAGTGSACRTTCGTDADCTSSHYCATTTCAPKLGNGASCTAGNQCLTGNCIDGVCCNTLCGGGAAGDCQSCIVAGMVGSCAPEPQGTVCGAASCANATTSNLPDTCNGFGTCTDGGQQNCYPFACDPPLGMCNGDCDTNVDCASGLVCFNAPGGFCVDENVNASRLNGGAVQDPSGIGVAVGPFNQSSPAVAFDGINNKWAVAYTDDSSGSKHVFVRLIDSTGAVLSTVQVSGNVGNQTDPAIAFDGTNFLVVWSDTKNGGQDIIGTRLTPTLIVLEPGGISISLAANNQVRPAIAFGATNYFVVWGDFKNGLNYEVYGTRVSMTGVVSNPAGIAISTFNGDQDHASLAFDGTNWLIAWQDSRGGNNDIRAARMNQTGTLLDSVLTGVVIVTMTGDQIDPSVTFGAGQCYIAWEDQRLGGANLSEIFAARVTTSPSVNVLDAGGKNLSAAGNRQSAPAAVYNGTHYVVVWTDERTGVGQPHIYGCRADTSNVVLEPAGIPIQTGPHGQTDPAIAKGLAGTVLSVWEGF